MENSLSIISIILFIGAGQGVLFSVVLFSIKKGNQLANRLLALMILLFSFTIFAHTLGMSESTVDKTDFDHTIVQLIFLLFGPLLFFYVRALCKSIKVLKKTDLFHLLPFLVLLVFFVIIQNSSIERNSFENYISIGSIIVISVHITIYIGQAISVLQKNTRLIKDNFSSIEKINLSWLRFLITGLLIIFPCALLIEIFSIHSDYWNFVWLIVAVFIYAIGFKGLYQPEIYLGSDVIKETGADNESKKYQKSALPGEKIEEYFIRVENYMAEAKPHLDCNLTLPELAKKVSISTHHLSQVINEKTGSNFYNYINSYRVKEAKSLLKNPTKQSSTILALAFEAGFNSVSSFNSVFKKLVGTTPSHFQKSK